MNGLFDFHKLNENGQNKAKAIAESFDNLLTEIEPLVSGGGVRELAIVRTKLEEACFYAKKAMALNANNQEPK